MIKKIKFSNKKIYLSITIFFFIFFIYLSIPALYTFKKLKPEIENKLSNDFGLKIDLKKGKYVFFPSPRFKFKDSRIFHERNRLISNKNLITIPINIFNLIGIKNLKYNLVEISNSTLNFEFDDLKKLDKFFLNISENKKINILKSELFINNDEDTQIALIEVKKMKIYSINNNPKIIANTEIFKTAVNFSYEKNNYFQLSIPEIVLTLKTIFNNDQINNFSKTIIRVPKNLFTINHQYKNNKFIIDNSKLDLDFSDGNFEGLVDLNPFFFNLNFMFNNMNFLELLENKLKIFQNFQVNKKINGKMKININNLSSKLKNNISSILNIELKNSNLNINNFDIIIEDVGKLTTKGTLYLKENKKKLNFFTNITIDNYKEFYSSFLINKKKRNNNLNLDLRGSYDFNNNKINLETISNNKEELSLKEVSLYSDKINKFIYNKPLFKMINRIQLRIFINSLFN